MRVAAPTSRGRFLTSRYDRATFAASQGGSGDARGGRRLASHSGRACEPPGRFIRTGRHCIVQPLNECEQWACPDPALTVAAPFV